MDNAWMSNEDMESKEEERRKEHQAKLRKIKTELARLRKQFKEIDPNKKELVQTTISDVAYMTVEMEYLREAVMRDGTQMPYKNGENQYGTKQNPDAQLYLQMSQKQTAAIKILIDCLPKEKAVEKDDGFYDFIRQPD